MSRLSVHAKCQSGSELVSLCASGDWPERGAVEAKAVSLRDGRGINDKLSCPISEGKAFVH